MSPFVYACPSDVGQAVALLRQHPDAKLLGGGQSLLAAMKLRLAAPSHLLDLGRIRALRSIRLDGPELVIGAMATHTEVWRSALVRRSCPALSALAGGIGDQQIRNRGTAGGSVANNDPAACYPAGVLALDARIVTDRRSINANDFFQGLYSTALDADEVLVEMRFAVNQRAAYVKFEQPASRFALLGVAVAMTPSGPRVAVTGAGNGVFRSAVLEARLRTRFDPTSLEGLALEVADFSGDLHAESDYRAHLAVVLARRATALAIANPPSIQ